MARNHTSVMHGVQRHRDAVRNGEQFAADREAAIRLALSGQLSNGVLRLEPLRSRAVITEYQLPVDSDANERFALALVAAHPELVLHLLRAQPRPVVEAS
jgi:hypothetical protein